MYTVITPNEAQLEALLEKHLKFKPVSLVSLIKKVFGFPNNSILSGQYKYDDEDDIGFVSLTLASGKKVSYQLRGDKPCFVEFTGFASSIRYDIAYPKGEMYAILQKEGLYLQAKFWAGGSI